MFVKFKRALMALFALMVICAGGGASAGQSAAEREGMKAVRAVLDRQVEAWNRRDLEGFMAGYWESPGLTFFSNSRKTSGWGATLDRYKSSYQGEGKQMGRLEFLEVEIEMLAPRAAFVRGRFHLKMDNSEMTGPFTLIFKKIKGDWKIIHDHTSSGQ
jgi:beta-aspartyl-peptidase (threonine type)